MHIPSAGMIGNSRCYLDQPIDQPVHRPLYFLAPGIELLNPVQEVVDQNSYHKTIVGNFDAMTIPSGCYREVFIAAIYQHFTTLRKIYIYNSIIRTGQN
jgi:hypothetical protein